MQTNYFITPLKRHTEDALSYIPLIRSNDFNQEVLLAKRMVLLLCTLQNDSFSKQRKVIDFVSNRHGDKVKVCLLAEEFIGQFSQNYNIKGTPTFLFFSEGMEIDRILGCVDCPTVSKYIARHLPL